MDMLPLPSVLWMRYDSRELFFVPRVTSWVKTPNSNTASPPSWQRT
jgi:hypothetical protein